MADIEATEARINITWAGKNGDMPDPVPYDASDADIKTWAAEAVSGGGIPGLDPDPNVDFTDYVVDRFEATEDVPNRIFLRPKTPFGDQPNPTVPEGWVPNDPYEDYDWCFPEEG